LSARRWKRQHQKVHSFGELLGGTKNMARGKLEFLSSEEIRRIHDTAVKVLEQVGVVVNSGSVSRLLIDNGCTQSKDGLRVLVPESVVKSALAKVPKSILLASRDGKHDMRVPSDRLYATNGGEGVYVKDLVTGERHTPTTEDVRNFFVLSGDLPQTDFCWPMVGAQDYTPHLKGFIEMKIGYESTHKHIQSAASDAEEARNLQKLATILTGGQDRFAKRPIWSAVQCPISPLTFEASLVEAQVELAKSGVPVVSMSAAVAGMTSPVTIAGTIAQITAENLASLVITQTSSKGAPWIFSSDSVPGDLKSGSIDYGSLEANLMRSAAGQMGRFYGLPTMVVGLGIEGQSMLLGRAREGVPIMAMQALVNSDLGSGFGGLDEAAGASYEQLVADAWVWDSAKEFIRTFTADETAISFETIREAGIDGNFLGKRHTLGRFKQESAGVTKPEAVMSGICESEPRGTLIKKAKEEAYRILKAQRESAVTRDEADEMDKLLRSLR
jgi:trimethylamine--corrinoid protein Co-methyltransferase